jgi:predicted dinucleotide-binding enzyme
LSIELVFLLQELFIRRYIMKIGILGSGMVGRTIAAKLAQNGHAVMLGTRDVQRTLAHNEPDFMGNPPVNIWIQQNPSVKLDTFAETGAFGDIIFNCTLGMGSLEALQLAGESNLNGKVLVDISNPLDFSRGMPPTLTVCNTDSLGEQIQRAFPQAKVVKTLNTITAPVMVNPAMIAGDHDVFVSGEDSAAKAQVTNLLKTEFGWKNVVDLGGISTARGVEMMMPVWLSLMSALQTPFFGYKIVK